MMRLPVNNSVASKIIDTLIVRAQKTPYFHLPDYMNRWWLWRLFPDGRVIPGSKTPDNAKFKFSAKIHQILRSDPETHHDHPWWYLTIILRGGYWECKPVYDKSGLYQGDSRKWYGPGSILLRKHTNYHRLEVPEGKDAWTLFITGPYKQKWGFLVTPAAKVRYDVHLKAIGKFLG